MASPFSDEDGGFTIDPSAPLRGVIVCCTSIPPEQRTEIDQQTVALGGIHKYDLTPDVTHLLVGDYDTPKYRHVAREREDIKAMDAAWIEALTELWKNDEDIEYLKLEREYQLKPLQRRGLDASCPAEQGPLLICLTGFGDQRDAIATKITENGALYTGDLTRRCSHLIVNKPEGKKFTAAKSWGVRTVTLAWLDQSIERGLILEESKYDPLLPLEEQGRDAWMKRDKRRLSLGKRSRSTGVEGQPEGARKLRKTASMKLSSQQNNLWGDILGGSTSREYSFTNDDEPQHHEQTSFEQTTIPTAVAGGIFSNCVFCLHGFSTKQAEVLEQTIASLDGATVTSVVELQGSGNESQTVKKFLIVPQAALSDTYPSSIPDNLHIVTEFFIEKCLHSKQFSNPGDHVLGRPFPSFPIKGFSDLTICTAAFTGLELYHVAKSITQLGAKLEEQFRPSVSILLCRSLDSLRKDKLKYAIEWKVPVVSADWLWECISTGRSAPIANFIYPSLRRMFPKQQYETQPTQPAQSNPMKGTRSEISVKPSKASKSNKPPPAAGIDTSAFDTDFPLKKLHSRLTSDAFSEDPNAAVVDTSNRTTSGDTSEAPLSELSSASLNKSPSPTKSVNPATLRKPSSESDSSRKSDKSKTSERDQTKPPGEDKARKAARNAEREQLTSRLTTLLDSAAANTDIDPSAGTAPAAPKTRKRQILGRAMSNASNSSSAAGVAADSFKRTVSALQAEEDDGDQEQPPPTQVQYHDPQAQERRKLLMTKMMGQAASEVTAGGRNLRTRSG